MGPYTHEEVYAKYGFFRTNPMGSAINGDGSVRLINDLSHPKKDPTTPSVNSFVDKNNYKTNWDDFKTVAKFLREHPGDWLLAVVDWAKAYRQLGIHPCQRRYLCILDFEGRIWVELAVGFGGVASCGIFGAPAETWKHIIIKKLNIPNVFRWVDNNLILKRPDDQVTLKDITDLSTDLGVKTNPLKNRDFEDEQRFLGSIWNGRNHTVRLSEDKLKQRVDQIKDFLQVSETWKLLQVETCVGRLVHTVCIVPHMTPYLNALHRWKKGWKKEMAGRRAPADVLEDLKEWEICMNTFSSCLIIPNPSPEEVGWVGDVASSFG